MDLKVPQQEGRTRVKKNSYNFLTIAKQEAREGITKDVQTLLNTCHADKKEELTVNLKGFQDVFDRFISDDEGFKWNNITAPPDDMIKPYDTLNEPSYAGMKEMLNKLVVLKLNGRLEMGGTGPKSLINIRNDITFLDMQVQQIEHLNDKYECAIPLVFMNSFNTDGHEDTRKVLRKYAHINVPIHTFQQSQYPQIYKESLRTVLRSAEECSDDSWYPPGHGDFYQSFYNSGLLQKFIDEGKEYIFVSNIDNLGATVDLRILDYLLNQQENEPCEFLMEVTDKTRADVKGGTLIKYNNKVRLLEIGQVPKEHVEDFKSISKLRIFNTNNLWMQLSAIKHTVESKTLHLEVIALHKQLDNGNKIIELQTAAGAAIKCFSRSICINVPRSRFLPVKTCSDLFLVLSNLYRLKHGVLSMTPERQFSSTPLVNLGNYFNRISDFLSRFETIPNIIDLDHLTVAGDVTFGGSVVLKGTVIIIANHGEHIDIPPGAILENKILSGNLRIMNH